MNWRLVSSLMVGAALVLSAIPIHVNETVRRGHHVWGGVPVRCVPTAQPYCLPASGRIET